MSRPRTLFVDASIIPTAIFTYRDDDFYSIVSQLAGSDEVELLKIQSIRTVHSFLRIANVFDILTIDSDEINSIKRQIRFILSDNTYVIKSGIQGSIEYLRDLFLKKQSDAMKNTNRSNLTPQSAHTTLISTNDTMSQESLVDATANAPIDHRKFILDSIDEWHLKHLTDAGLPSSKLIEGVDFFLSLPSKDGDSAMIRCRCRASSTLPRQGVSFQLSSFYRHLKTAKCSMFKSKLKSTPVDDDEQDVPTTTLDEPTTQSSFIIDSTLDVRSPDSNSPARSKRMASSTDPVVPTKKRQRKEVNSTKRE